MILNLIPDREITNTGNIGLLTNIHTHRNLARRIAPNINKETKEELKGVNLKEGINALAEIKSLLVSRQDLVSFEVLLTKEEGAKFYLFFDERNRELIKNEIGVCWPKVTAREEEDPVRKIHFDRCQELELYNHYFLSLKADRRGAAEYPLSSWLESSRMIKEGEAVLIQVLMEPEEPEWVIGAEEAIKDFQRGKVAKRIKLTGKGAFTFGMKMAYAVATEAMSIVKLIITNDDQLEWENIEQLENGPLLRRGMSENSQRKSAFQAYDTSIRIAVKSPDRDRQGLLLNTFTKTFNDLTEDNSLIPARRNEEKLREAIYFRQPMFKINKDLLSTRELGQIIQLPTWTYQQQYAIANVDQIELNIPKELQERGIPIGTFTYRGREGLAYWRRNFNIAALPKVIIGPMGAGKSEYVINYAIEAAKQGRAVVVFDYIKNCEMSAKIKKYLLKDPATRDRIEELDLGDLLNPILLAFNEYTPGGTPLERQEIANIQSGLTEYTINALIGEGTDPLSERMKRFLHAASMVAYIHPEGSIRTVISILNNHKVRADYIEKAIKSGVFKEEDDEIEDLRSLDEVNQRTGKVTGTKETKIEGIMDRISMLQRNIYLKLMLTGSRKLDFVELLNQKKIILLKMPQAKYPSKAIKDTLITFLLGKLWAAGQIRGAQQEHPGLTDIIVDEIHQVPTAARFIETYITECRKFGLSFLFTIHFLKQFKQLHNAVKSAGVSYMLLAGTEKENLQALEEEIRPFTVEHGMRMKPFHSLNVINYGNQRAVFVSRMPKDLP